jgi:hypothetical protein
LVADDGLISGGKLLARVVGSEMFGREKQAVGFQPEGLEGCFHRRKSEGLASSGLEVSDRQN